MKELRLHGEVVVTGMGSIQYLNRININRVFIVTGQGSMLKNGTIDIITNILVSKGCQYNLD
jgi:alcohol dehydrogenase YqhD (iron-dependent ADH family)